MLANVEFNYIWLVSMDILIPTSNQLNRFLDKLSLVPSVVFAKNAEGVYLGVNHKIADICGKNSAMMVGSTDLDFCWRDRYELYRANDQMVEKSKKAHYFIDPVRNKNNEIVTTLIVKAPLSHINEQADGTVAIGVLLNQEPYTKILSQFILASELLKLDVNSNVMLRVVIQSLQLNNLSKQWKSKKPLFDYGKIKFTLREAQCLHYMLNHFSATKTSEKLFISQKTVEFHRAKIKRKLNCRSITQITNKAVDEGFIDIMFMNFE